MPKLDTLQLKILTGQRGPNKVPTYEINGFELDFDEIQGDTLPGSTIELSGSPQSFPHALALIGPENGSWDIDRIEATYFPMGEPSYTVRLGAITLDGETKLNLKIERQPELLDV